MDFKLSELQQDIANLAKDFAEKILENHLAENEEAKKEWEKDFKLKNDPRITKVGFFLRKTR